MNQIKRIKNKLVSIAIISSSLMAFSAPVQALDDETTRDIRDFVTEYVTDLIQNENPGVKAEVTLPNLENRVNMTSCTGFLYAELVKKDLSRRSNSVKLMCEDPDHTWNSIVPIRIKYLKPAVVALQSISKGQELTAENITIAYIEGNKLNGNYFVNVDTVMGAKSKRELAPNAIIKNDLICLVCKDDLVDLEAGTDEVSIKVQGKAQEDGSLNQDIRVENMISHKIVRAKVVGVGHLKIEVK